MYETSWCSLVIHRTSQSLCFVFGPRQNNARPDKSSADIITVPAEAQLFLFQYYSYRVYRQNVGNLLLGTTNVECCVPFLVFIKQQYHHIAAQSTLPPSWEGDYVQCTWVARYSFHHLYHLTLDLNFILNSLRLS